MTGMIDRAQYSTVRFGIRLDRMASLALGFLVVFSAPINDDLLVKFGEYYRLNFFELVAIPTILLGLMVYGIRIKRYEQFVFGSLILVLMSRIISLPAAQEVAMIQWAGILRYTSSTVGVIYILANLFTDPKNRERFIYGVIIAVAIEIMGGLGIFILSRGVGRGYFFSVAVAGLEAFLVFACILGFLERKRRFLMIGIICLLSLSIVATLSRGALISLLLVFTIAVLYAGYSRGQWLQAIVPIAGVVAAFLVIITVAPWTKEQLLWRIEAGILGKEGGVDDRRVLYEMAINAFLRNPVMGIGAGAIKEQQGSLEALTRDTPVGFGDRRHSPHSTVLGILGETGIIGFGAYLLWVIAAIGLCMRALDLAKQRAVRDNKYGIAASLWIILGIAYGDLFSEASFYPSMNSLMGFLLGWLRGNRRDVEHESD